MVDFITDARFIPACCGDEKVEGLPSGVTRILGHGIEQFTGLLGEEFIKYKTGNIEALVLANSPCNKTAARSYAVAASFEVV